MLEKYRKDPRFTRFFNHSGMPKNSVDFDKSREEIMIAEMLNDMITIDNKFYSEEEKKYIWNKLKESGKPIIRKILPENYKVGDKIPIIGRVIGPGETIFQTSNFEEPECQTTTDVQQINNLAIGGIRDGDDFQIREVSIVDKKIPPLAKGGVIKDYNPNALFVEPKGTFSNKNGKTIWTPLEKEKRYNPIMDQEQI